MWKCKNCGKRYAKQNQSHKCESNPVEVLLRFDPKLIALYNELLDGINEIGEFDIKTSSKAITFSGKVAFAVIYARRYGLELGLFLDFESNYKGIYKRMQNSKSKIYHVIKVTETSDITSELLGLIHSAYQISIK